MKRVFIKEVERMKEIRIFDLDNNTFTFYYPQTFLLLLSFFIPPKSYKSIILFL